MAKTGDQHRPEAPDPAASATSAAGGGGGDLDLLELEKRILDRWEREDTFARVRRSRAEGPLFRFLDGPITANNPMGIHHARGRTLKDVFLRYKSLRGHTATYQNGFDCQGLWVEVEVEKALGFAGKGDIEAYGLDRFSQACRARVDEFSELIARQSIRLGQWMDWDHSYFTYDDANILGIWHFLALCHERGWLYRSGRPMPWCPRCGTSLSEHEMAGSYRDVEHLAVWVALPLADGSGRSLAVWTTTPWTLPANVAAAVHPELEYCELEVPDRPDRVVLCSAAVERLGLAGARVVRRFPGRELVGLGYETAFSELPAQREVAHRVVAWDEVDAAEGTGIVHIAPGCGREDFELGRAEGLDVLAPVDEAGLFEAGYGWLAGRAAAEVGPAVAEALESAGKLLRAGPHAHSYPVCWRCKSELLFRLVSEWFIACDEIRGPMIEATRSVAWHPPHMGKRMEDWLRNMGDWCISRKRYWGLPLPFYTCEACEAVHVVGSREELRERALDPGAVDALPELHRPWIDEVPIRCPACSGTSRRVREVGDCWLDAGIVPFTTLGYFDDPERFERHFPVDFVCEMHEQVRLWFYSLLFMSVTIRGQAPYRAVLAYDRVVSETGQMFSKTGFMIRFDEAVEKLGADVLRYLYCATPAPRELRFSFEAGEVVRRRLLALWNVAGFLHSYAEIDRPQIPEPPAAPDLAVSDRWLLARAARLLADAEAAYETWDTPAVVRAAEAALEDVSNWYIRTSRRRFWRGGAARDKGACYFALREAVSALLRVLAPVVPFLAEDLWGQVVRPLAPGAADSLFLDTWPELAAWADPALLERTERVRRAVALTHALRAEHGLKVRQPLAVLWVAGDDLLARALEEQRDAVAAEVNVKRVEWVSSDDAFYDPHLAVDFKKAGPLLRDRVQAAKRALAEAGPETMGRWVEQVEAGRPVEIPGVEAPVPPEVLRRERAIRTHLRVASEPGCTVALDASPSPELRREGLARDVVRRVQVLRKEAGLSVTQRIELALETPDPELARAIDAHAELIAGEVLAERLARGSVEDAEARREWTVEGATLRAELRAV